MQPRAYYFNEQSIPSTILYCLSYGQPIDPEHVLTDHSIGYELTGNELISNRNGLALLVHMCWSSAESRGFHDLTPILTVGDLSSLLNTELGELYEDYRDAMKKGYVAKEDLVRYYCSSCADDSIEPNCPKCNKLCKVNGILSEIADVVIRCFDFAGRLGYFGGFAAVLLHKMKYNLTRPAKHGRGC